MRKLLLCFSFVITSASAPVMAGGGGSVAVLDIMTTAVDPQYVSIMTEILAVEIQALGVYDSVIAGRDIATMIGFERQRDIVGCDHAECLIELGGALGVDRLVAGHVAKIGETFVVQIKLINIVNQKTEARVYQTVKGREDILIQTIKDSVNKLVPPKIDPSQPVSGVALARPNASVEKNQAPSQSGGVAPWVLMGLGLAGGAAGAFFGAQAKAHLDNAQDPAFEGAQLEIDVGESKALYANISYGAGAAAVITGLVLWMTSGGDKHDASSRAGLIPLADGAAVTWRGQF